MFLDVFYQSQKERGFPRIRGDVPHAAPRALALPKFSPHTRGCSADSVTGREFGVVFPAYAGMFRVLGSSTGIGEGFPRIRGDVPPGDIRDMLGGAFSPHTRGCSGSDLCGVGGGAVFPAYAGMFLKPDNNPPIPHWFSPHTRGCSVSADSDNWWVAVFPAYAGMFRRGSNPCSFAGVFSPHTRGCSFPLLKRWKSSAGFLRIRGDVPDCSLASAS